MHRVFGTDRRVPYRFVESLAVAGLPGKVRRLTRALRATPPAFGGVSERRRPGLGRFVLEPFVLGLEGAGRGRGSSLCTGPTSEVRCAPRSGWPGISPALTAREGNRQTTDGPLRARYKSRAMRAGNGGNRLSRHPMEDSRNRDRTWEPCEGPTPRRSSSSQDESKR